MSFAHAYMDGPTHSVRHLSTHPVSFIDFEVDCIVIFAEAGVHLSFADPRVDSTFYCAQIAFVAFEWVRGKSYGGRVRMCGRVQLESSFRLMTVEAALEDDRCSLT